MLYALGGSGGGLSLYLDQGQLVYEYNMMIIERYTARSKNKIPAGRHRIEVTTTLASAKPLSPAEVVLTVDGREVARTTAKRTVRLPFPPAKRLMWAWILVQRCRSTTSSAGRSASTALHPPPVGPLCWWCPAPGSPAPGGGGEEGRAGPIADATECADCLPISEALQQFIAAAA